MLRSKEQNHSWPTTGPGGYWTLGVWAVPYASQQGTKSQVAHKWAKWLHGKWAWWLHGPYRLGRHESFSEGQKLEVAHKGDAWLHNLHCLGDPQHFKAGTQSQAAHKGAGWLKKSSRVGAGGGGQRFKVGDKIRSGPQLALAATLPLLLGGPQRFKAETKIKGDPQGGWVAT